MTDTPKIKEDRLVGERADAVKRERRRRQDTGETSGLKLYVPPEMKEPGYTYRFINDTAGGRIHQKTVNDDWEVVMTKTPQGDGIGTPYTKIVGPDANGQPLRAVLCRKPLDWHQEDQAKKQAAVDAREDAIRKGAMPSPEGLKGPIAYIPDRHEGFSSEKQGENRIGRSGKYQP